MKYATLTRKTSNPHWPAILTADIVITNCDDWSKPSRYAFLGRGIDAHALCPSKTYLTLEEAIRAGQTMGWEIVDD